MAKIVVVGGGIAGAATALFLARRGAEVSIVDAEQPGSAATGAAAGMLAPQYESAAPGPLFAALVRGRGFFPEFASLLEELSGEALRIRWDGMLVASWDTDQHARAEQRAAWQREAGQEAEILEVAAAMRLQPGISGDAVSYLWLPGEGQVDSQQLAGLLPRALRKAGVQVLGSRRVREVEIEKGRVQGVELTDDRFLRADAVVVAAGAWSGMVGRVPVRIPVRPVRGHLLRFAAGTVPLRHMVAEPAGRFVLPRADDAVLVGSSMEEAGFDRSTDAAAVRTIHEVAARLVPVLGSREPAASWADLRPISVDGLPIIGADSEAEGLFYATGYGRTGILLSPLAGQVVADLVLGGALPEEWEDFSPARLH